MESLPPMYSCGRHLQSLIGWHLHFAFWLCSSGHVLSTYFTIVMLKDSLWSRCHGYIAYGELYILVAWIDTRAATLRFFILVLLEYILTRSLNY